MSTGSLRFQGSGIRSGLSLVGLSLLALLVLSPGPGIPSTKDTSAKVSQVRKARLMEAYGKLPLSFEANQGQTGSRVQFLSRGPGYSLFLTATEAVLALAVPSAKEDAQPRALRMKLMGAHPGAEVSGLEELPGKSNYFMGNDPSQWRTNVTNYAKVRYQQVYPGVDLIYYGNQGQLEYDFVVAPGADPNCIQLAFDGADKLEVDAQGDLVVHTGASHLRLRKPIVYQEVAGIRHPITGAYQFKGKRQVSFEIASHNPQQALVIDPVLVYSTYLGGSGVEYGSSIAVDSSGSAYVTGLTCSGNFPIVNAVQPIFPSCSSAFVAKLNPAGTALVYSTYLGGGFVEEGRGIAVDSSGNAYVTGIASAKFPTTPDTFGRVCKSLDAFVTKLSPSGSALLYSTCLGGGGSDRGSGIAVDGEGNAYVTGETSSADFPTAGPTQTSFGGGTCSASREPCPDAFAAKLNPPGSALVYSMYLGGGGVDSGQSIAVDAVGSAYVTGSTNSINFPTTPGAWQAAWGGVINGFVAKLTNTGFLLYSTYLGGGGQAAPSAVAVDGAGNAYVTGSAGNNFSTTVRAFQPTLAGVYDAFVLKLNPSGSAPVYSTYLGGSSYDSGNGIAVDLAGNAYLTGDTTSDDFPTMNRFQSKPVRDSLDHDAFVAELNAAGSALVYSTYLGGSRNDAGRGIAVDSFGNTYVTGLKNSADFPAVNSLQVSGGVFITKLHGRLALTLTSLSPPGVIIGQPGLTLTVTGVGLRPDCLVRWNGNNRVTAFVSSTELLAFVLASDVAVAGTARVTVFTPGPDGGTSNALPFDITNPMPTLTSLSPASVTAGSAGFTMTIRGSGFFSGSIVRWNGSDRATTFVSTTVLQVPVFPADIVVGRTSSVTVFNPSPGGGLSNSLTFIISGNPAPVLHNLLPGRIVAGSPGFTVNVNGRDFVSGSLVRWNGSERATTFINTTQLQAAIPASDVAAPGTAQVTVLSPPPGRGVSNPQTFPIDPAGLNPFPTLRALQPSTIIVGSADFTLTVEGANFVARSVVRWNGSDRSTTYVSGTLLQASIPAGDVAAAGTALVTVFNPAPGGGLSSPLSLTISLGPITLSSLSPAGTTAGGPGFNLTVNGSGFIAGASVRWNGSDRATTFVTSSRLDAHIPASDIASPGTALVTVYLPPPVNALSNALPFVVSARTPPGYLVVQVANLSGAFVNGATVSVAGQPSKTTAGNGEASFTLPPGIATVQVSASGFQAASATTNVFAGQASSLALTLVPEGMGTTRTVSVPALAEKDFDTGLEVRAGQTLILYASGTWGYSPAPSDFPLGPDGRIGCQGAAGWTLPDGGKCGALAARIGSSDWFYTSPAFAGQARSSGRFFLSINDLAGTFADNRGSLTVRITVLDTPICSIAEPKLNITLLPGFYIAEVRTAPGTREGYWGMEVAAERGLLAGGFNLGGGVQESGGPPGFGAFYVPGAQTVKIRLDAQVLSGGDASLFSMRVRLLDSNRQQVGAEQTGATSLQFQQALSEGFYILEVRAADGAPRATFQLGLGAEAFGGGVIVGGFLQPSLVGFGAFYVPQAQEVGINVTGLPTYTNVGASCLRLTLLDSARQVIRTVP